MSVDARKERFELVEVFDRPMLFTCLRVDRNTVPKGLYLYEVRNDDDQCGIPVEIGRWIMVNHWGTLLSATPIKLEPNRYNNKPCRAEISGPAGRPHRGDPPAQYGLQGQRRNRCDQRHSLPPEA